METASQSGCPRYSVSTVRFESALVNSRETDLQAVKPDVDVDGDGSVSNAGTPSYVRPRNSLRLRLRRYGPIHLVRMAVASGVLYLA